MKPSDITGRKFGRLEALTFVRSVTQGKQKRQMWLFRCDCGNEAILRKDSVMHGLAPSCGCQGASQLAELNAKRSQEKASTPAAPPPKHPTHLPATVQDNRSHVPASMRHLPSRVIRERHVSGNSDPTSHLPRQVSSSGWSN